MERLDLEFYYGQEAEQFTFYRLPKALMTDNRFKEVSNNAKLLYGLMLDRMGLSARSGWFDEENRVYIKYAVKSIMEDLNCSKMTAVGLLKELQAIGLIDMVQKSGLANIIYVINFVSESKSASKGEKDALDQSNNCTSKESVPVELDKHKNETGIEIRPVHQDDQSESMTGTGTESGQAVVQNMDPNNKELSNTELSNNHPITLSREVEPMDEAEAYMQLIRENIEYDAMMSCKTWRDRVTYEELYQLICDVVCVPRKTIRIGGEDYPYNLVKSKFLKLTSSNLEYVISCMNNNTTKISNIRAYLITALYNAPNTINSYYQAEVNYDMYGAWRDGE